MIWVSLFKISIEYKNEVRLTRSNDLCLCSGLLFLARILFHIWIALVSQTLHYNSIFSGTIDTAPGLECASGMRIKSNLQGRMIYVSSLVFYIW